MRIVLHRQQHLLFDLDEYLMSCILSVVSYEVVPSELGMGCTTQYHSADILVCSFHPLVHLSRGKTKRRMDREPPWREHGRTHVHRSLFSLDAISRLSTCSFFDLFSPFCSGKVERSQILRFETSGSCRKIWSHGFSPVGSSGFTRKGVKRSGKLPELQCHHTRRTAQVCICGMHKKREKQGMLSPVSCWHRGLGSRWLAALPENGTLSAPRAAVFVRRVLTAGAGGEGPGPLDESRRLRHAQREGHSFLRE
ncbi:hypothetical protein GE09DRAFT_112050 [Coniochaeta sp. 2T2.1]|nr:hypothetical protein GE09DRAFT_112050 [Coniochaeta sp. 2T2.1]